MFVPIAGQFNLRVLHDSTVKRKLLCISGAFQGHDRLHATVRSYNELSRLTCLPDRSIVYRNLQGSILPGTDINRVVEVDIQDLPEIRIDVRSFVDNFLSEGILRNTYIKNKKQNLLDHEPGILCLPAQVDTLAGDEVKNDKK